MYYIPRRKPRCVLYSGPSYIQTSTVVNRLPGEGVNFGPLTQSYRLDIVLDVETDFPHLFFSEKQRCAAVKRCELFIRVFYNDKEVCRTDVRSMADRFVVSFKERFSIKLRQPPVSIKLLLVEDGAGAGRHPLAELFLPIPAG